MQSKRPISIATVYTGGTIGGKEQQGSHAIEDDLRGEVFNEELQNLLKHQLPCLPNIVPINPLLRELSEEFYPELMWRDIVKAIRQGGKEEVDGILVIHGTDTLAYTASFVSFECAGLGKPIVFVAANKPLKTSGSDAGQNLLDAFFLLSQKLPNAVLTTFSGVPGIGSTVHAGVYTRKVRFTRNSFASANANPLAKIEMRKSLITGGTFKKRRLQITNPILWDRISRPTFPHDFSPLEKVQNKASLFKIYPGFDPAVIEFAVEKKGAAGIVLEVYNSGTACTKGPYSIIPSLEMCKGKGIPVFITSQQVGYVKFGPYGSSKSIEKAGGIALGSMTTECALAKLIWVLSHTPEIKRIRELMLKDLVGEHFYVDISE